MEELARQARALGQLGRDMLEQQQSVLKPHAATPAASSASATASMGLSAAVSAKSGHFLRPPSAPSGGSPLRRPLSFVTVESTALRRHSEVFPQPRAPEKNIDDDLPLRLDALLPHILFEARSRAASRAVAKDDDALGNYLGLLWRPLSHGMCTT
jgi:hypothetical protein